MQKTRAIQGMCIGRQTDVQTGNGEVIPRYQPVIAGNTKS